VGTPGCFCENGPVERYRDSVGVALPPGECLDRAEEFLAGRGFAVEHRDARTLAVSRGAYPDPWVGLLLLLLFVVPGVAYFALAPRRTATTTVLAVPDDFGGGTELSYVSEGLRSRRVVGKLFGDLSDGAEPHRR
jgi:hypothetical protein